MNATNEVVEPTEPTEPTEPEGEPTEPVEPEPEPEEPEAAVEPPPAAESLTRAQEREMEAAAKKLESEATRHANRVSEIMGEAAQDLLPCPRCLPNVPGFIYPVQMVPLLPDQLAAVKFSIGMGIEPELRSDREAYVCPDCDGHGKVRTGSLVPRQEVLKCEACDGRGWVGRRADRPAHLPLPENGAEPLVAVGAPDEKPATDPWGRVRGEVDFGVMPGYEQD